MSNKLGFGFWRTGSLSGVFFGSSSSEGLYVHLDGLLAARGQQLGPRHVVVVLVVIYGPSGLVQSYGCRQRTQLRKLLQSLHHPRPIPPRITAARGRRDRILAPEVYQVCPLLEPRRLVPSSRDGDP